MRTITQVTEKRINEMIKNNHKYGLIMNQMLSDIKAWFGFTESMSIKRIKEIYEDAPKNAVQYECPRYLEGFMWALEMRFPELISCTFCLDLHYVNVKDFNKLVVAVSKIENNGYKAFGEE